MILDWKENTLSFEINFESKGVGYNISENEELYYFCVSTWVKNQSVLIVEYESSKEDRQAALKAATELKSKLIELSKQKNFSFSDC